MARKRTLFFRRVRSLLKPWLLAFTSLAIALSLIFIPVRISATESLLDRGKNFYDRTQYNEAVEVLQQAVFAFEADGDKSGMAIAWGNLSLAYQQLGQWQQAERAISTSLNLLPTASAELDSELAQILAQTLDVRGRLELELGRDRAAVDTWQQTVDLYRQLEDEAGIIRSQINQAQAMSGLGMYFQAEKILTEIGLLQNQPDPVLKTTVLRSTGNVYRNLGELDRSRQVLEQSLAIAKANSIPTGDILLSLGNTVRVQGDRQTALNFYIEAVTNAASASTRIQAQLNQLSLLNGENPQAAIELVSKIESQLKSLPASHTTIYAQINLAENLQRLRRDNTNIFSESKLVQILTEARQQAEAIEDTPAISYALGNLAEVYAQSGELKRAIDLTNQALYWGQAVNDLNLTYRWQWQLGRLQKEAGNTTKAIAAYTEAVQNLETLRSNFAAVSSDIQFNFHERVEPVYRQLVDLLLSEDNKTSQSQIKSARSAIESLQAAELVNYFNEDCLILRSADFVDKKAAIVHTIRLDNRLEIILTLPGQRLRHYSVAKTPQQVKTLVEQLQQNLVLPYTTDSDILPLAQQVYDWLIRPAQIDLEKSGVETLAFVLDGSLQNLSMAALHDGRQYLIEKYEIALIPSLQLLDPQPITKNKLEAITAGLSQARFGFDPLEGVERELKQIDSEIPAQILLNREFTTTNLQREITNSTKSIVHVATHGQFSSQAEDTFILAWDRPINVNQLDDVFQIRQESQDALELLVLSACETATGDERAALGIAGVAIRSGARSTIASLWLVDDESTAQLMSHFYQQLNSGVTRGEALRAAQKTLLQNQKYNHPRYWAAFVLLGNWL